MDGAARIREVLSGHTIHLDSVDDDAGIFDHC
jgi:hypothetical protein